MAFEEPQIGIDIELGGDVALAMRAAIPLHIGDPVHHQHRRFGQLGISRPEQLSARAFEQVISIETAWIVGHPRGPFMAVSRYPSGWQRLTPEKSPLQACGVAASQF